MLDLHLRPQQHLPGNHLEAELLLESVTLVHEHGNSAACWRNTHWSTHCGDTQTAVHHLESADHVDPADPNNTGDTPLTHFSATHLCQFIQQPGPLGLLGLLGPLGLLHY